MFTLFGFVLEIKHFAGHFGELPRGMTYFEIRSLAGRVLSGTSRAEYKIWRVLFCPVARKSTQLSVSHMEG